MQFKLFLKTLLMTISTFTVSLYGFSASAEGTKDGGGGKGVLCHGKLRLLDLYEWDDIAHFPSGVHYPTLNENLEIYGSQLAAYTSEYLYDAEDPNFREWLRKAVRSYAFDRFRDIPPGSTIPLSNDATIPPLEDGCSIVQIAFYSDKDEVIFRDPVLWEMLSPYDQAGLILHELTYVTFRTEGHSLPPNSDKTRRLIARGMASQLRDPMLKPVWSAKRVLYCTSEQADSFDVIENESETKGLSIFFTSVKQNLCTTRTSAFLPNITLDDFSNTSSLAYLTQIHANPSLGEPPQDLLNLEIEHTGNLGLHSIKLRVWKNGEPKPEMINGQCHF